MRLITTLFSFPIHGFPDDYWRFSPHLMWHMLNDAGFKDIMVETDGQYMMQLSDHGEAHGTFVLPVHIFARARK